MRKEILLDKPSLEKWQLNPTTMLVWQKLQASWEVQAWRSCEHEKIEYWRGVADLMDELRKIFEAPKSE